jgi:nucleoside-diphosphate-sugar epimerase
MNFWNGKRVLVTGGASFIGSHLVRNLVGQGAAVRVADDLSSGRLDNLDGLLPDIDVQQCDLKERSSARRACAGIEVVFHLAACHGGRGFIDTHPVECSTNMILDGIVFAEAHRAGVERICFASSACVYPVNLQDDADENRLVYLKEDWANPFEPGKAQADGEYGWAKLMGEMALQAYHKQYGLKCASCRIFTAYGELENETHAVIALIAKAFVNMDPYVIWGTGEQDRNFTYVGDIADGMMLAAEKIEDGSTVNLGRAEHIRIRDAVERIFEFTGFRPKHMVTDTSKPVGVKSRAADLDRARKLLNWEPQTSFDDGLQRTIRWYYKTKSQENIAAKLEVLLTER